MADVALMCGGILWRDWLIQIAARKTKPKLLSRRGFSGGKLAKTIKFFFGLRSRSEL
jgi:hypothetical protein